MPMQATANHLSPVRTVVFPVAAAWRVNAGWSADASSLGGHKGKVPRRWDATADAAHLPVPDGCERRLVVQHPYDRLQLGLVQALGGGIRQVFLPW